MDFGKNRTTHTGVGAGSPKEVHPSPGAPAIFALPEEYGIDKDGDRSRVARLRMADAPVSASVKKTCFLCIGSGA